MVKQHFIETCSKKKNTLLHTGLTRHDGLERTVKIIAVCGQETYDLSMVGKLGE